jgi:hypothetical protein
MLSFVQLIGISPLHPTHKAIKEDRTIKLFGVPMALKQCKECKASISTDAKTCPICGKKQAMSAPLKFILGLFILIVLGGIFGEKDNSAKKQSPPKSLHQQQIEKQFSSWDGSHRTLERHIKDIMNDPSSYEHIETRYIDNGDHLLVFTRFRGKNGFGGMVQQAITAKIDMDGNIIEIVE